MKPAKKIPRSVIQKLNRDLAALTSDFAAETRPAKIRVPKRAKTITLQAESLADLKTFTTLGKPQLLAANPQLSSGTILTTIPRAADSSGWWDRMREKLTARAIELRNKYRDNPYILIRGFSIELGVPPSLSIDFEFKQ